MSVATVAAEHYRRQVALARRIAAESAAQWARLDPYALDRTWALILDRLLALLVGAQNLAASDADGYLDEVLAAQKLDAASAGAVNARAFAGIASDGRTLEGLLYEPVIHVKTAIKGGATLDRAMAGGALSLDMIVRTQIADAGRTAVGVGIAARRHVTGYVRMLSLPSCSRCVLLAGKWFRYNAGFQRHPRCDCRHIPARENDHDLRTDPDKYFASLSPAEQDRAFTKAGAQALRDGGDMSQIVNARSGMRTASVNGRDVQITTTGTTRRALARQRLGTGVVRLMPEQIYADAARLGLSRDQTLEILRRHAYIL